MVYNPNPINTRQIVLPKEAPDIQERLAENAHDIWAANKRSRGWTLGARYDDAKKKDPCLQPFYSLPHGGKMGTGYIS